MHPPDFATEPPAEEPLVLQALLYAAGGLGRAEAPRFGDGRGQAPGARGALGRAVAVAASLGGGGPARPHPAYRARVRRRLLPSQGLWGRLARAGGRPPRWPAAVAAVLLLVGGLT